MAQLMLYLLLPTLFVGVVITFVHIADLLIMRGMARLINSHV